MSRLVSMKLSLVTLLALVGLVGCSAPTDVSASTESATTDTQRLLDFVNYPDTDEKLLDLTVKLDSRAAKGIVAARAGADGVYPSSDDRPFTSVAALDAVAYVGSATIAKIQAYALAHPVPSGEVVEGVSFTGWQSVAVVWGVNHASVADLDRFLDSRAAKALVAGAPFASVAQMGPMAYVGASALTALRGQSATWWNASKQGFVLDESTRAADAELLKESLAEDEGFVEEVVQPLAGGDNSEGVAILQALENEIDVLTKPLVGTTYADADAAEAAVDAAAPVKSLTKSGGWTYLESIGLKQPPTTCVASFQSAVSSDLANLLFMSESDRPFDVVYFDGQGTKAPTAASVLALVHKPAGSTASIRAAANYFTALEGDDTAIANVETAFGTLTDVTYVAVFAPPNSIDKALVDVYLVGRTSCGDLVGVHAIAVET